MRRHNLDSTAKAEEIARDCRFIFLADYYMLTFLYTGAKGAWSENRVDTAGYMFIAEGVHVILINGKSEGFADITRNRFETFRTGSNKSGWFILATDKDDKIAGSPTFYYWKEN